MTAKSILIAASKLCDSATVHLFCDAHHAKVRLQLQKDGRCLFCLVSQGAVISPMFSQAFGLISHIYRVMESQGGLTFQSDIRVRL